MNKLHLYWGNGKGKTTAAMGLALRALGHHRRVLIAQFMKNGASGELNALRSFSEAIVYPSVPVTGLVSRMSPEEVKKTRREQTQMAKDLTAVIRQERPQVIILDELAIAWQRGIVEQEPAVELIQTALSCAETVTTGRDAPVWLLEHADYVSRIDAERHPYITEHLPAREGVEW